MQRKKAKEIPKLHVNGFLFRFDRGSPNIISVLITDYRAVCCGTYIRSTPNGKSNDMGKIFRITFHCRPLRDEAYREIVKIILASPRDSLVSRMVLKLRFHEQPATKKRNAALLWLFLHLFLVLPFKLFFLHFLEAMVCKLRHSAERGALEKTPRHPRKSRRSLIHDWQRTGWWRNWRTGRIEISLNQTLPAFCYTKRRVIEASGTFWSAKLSLFFRLIDIKAPQIDEKGENIKVFGNEVSNRSKVTKFTRSSPQSTILRQPDAEMVDAYTFLCRQDRPSCYFS